MLRVRVLRPWASLLFCGQGPCPWRDRGPAAFLLGAVSSSPPRFSFPPPFPSPSFPAPPTSDLQALHLDLQKLEFCRGCGAASPYPGERWTLLQSGVTGSSAPPILDAKPACSLFPHLSAPPPNAPQGERNRFRRLIRVQNLRSPGSRLSCLPYWELG